MDALVAKSLVRKNKSYKKKPVRCVDTGVIYASSRDAAEILASEGVMCTPEGISHTCQGRQRSTRGLRWEYVGIEIKSLL